MMRALMAWVSALTFLCIGFANAEELQPIPRLSARVTDLTGSFSPDQRAALDTKLAAFEREKGAQIAILLVPTTKPESVEQYSIRVVESWKLGRRNVEDGALLLVVKQERKMRIEVGYGLEGALTDAVAKRIISETIGPRFAQGEFYAGVDLGVEAMMRVIGGEPLPAPSSTPSRQAPLEGTMFDSLLPMGFLLVFVVGGILRSLFGRFLAACIIGGVAGCIAWWMVSSLLLGGIVGLIAFVVSLFAGITGGGGGWSSGGGSWGGSSSSGGFSGGGGGFGGGGASGSW